MLLTLLKALNTNKLDIIVANLSMSPLDVDVMLYEGQENGDIELNAKKGTIKALREPDHLYCNTQLRSQICKIIKYYDGQEANITRTRLEIVALNPNGSYGYTNHDFICTMYELEQSGEVNKYEISVPKTKKRPYHKFEFYTYLDHQEFGAAAVNKFIEQFEKK